MFHVEHSRTTRQRVTNQIMGLIRRRSDHLAAKALKLYDEALPVTTVELSPKVV